MLEGNAVRLLQSIAGLVEAMSKPWLAAKTAGECAARCMAETPGRWIDRCEVVAQAVIEWHEAQRERIGEYWRVDCEMIHIDARSVTKWSAIFYTHELAVTSARSTRDNDTTAQITHVTRYRRKRA